MSKDKELENLRYTLEHEKKSKVEIEDQLWKRQSEYKILEETNQAIQIEIGTLQDEVQKLKDAKERSDKIIDDLKDKLRIIVREHE